MNKTAPTNIESTAFSTQDQIDFANQVLSVEAAAINNIKIDDAFLNAVDLIIKQTKDHTGSLVVSGVGKSGLIGTKISATFASTGTPSHFLHPTEALHGDLGRIKRGDLVLLLSFGGNTEELVTLAAILKQDDITTISLTSTTNCDLARLSTINLTIGKLTEACSLNLAPSASTTATLALGDALALTVSKKLNFGLADFQKMHPGGSLGKQLLPITQAMRFRVGENFPLVTIGKTIQQAYQEANDNSDTNKRRAGALLITDKQGKLAGIFTDADLRRLLLEHGNLALQQPIQSVMTKNPRHLTDAHRVRDAVHMTQEYRIDEIPIVDQDNKPIGLLDVQDLIALKVIDG